MFSALRSNPVLVALLVWTQVLAAAAGPAGLVLCRDTDGSTHVEFLSDSCCVVDLEAGYDRAEAQGLMAGEPWCSGDECDDSLLPGSPVLMARVAARVADSDQVAWGVDAGFPIRELSPHGLPGLNRSRSQVADDDGLRPIRMGLRSTVLVL